MGDDWQKQNCMDYKNKIKIIINESIIYDICDIVEHILVIIALIFDINEYLLILITKYI